MGCKKIEQVLETVALFTRAWIEILSSVNGTIAWDVALFTRAWIEMEKAPYLLCKRRMSPSSRGRGLKLSVSASPGVFRPSPSSRGRGLKWNG